MSARSAQVVWMGGLWCGVCKAGEDMRSLAMGMYEKVLEGSECLRA